MRFLSSETIPNTIKFMESNNISLCGTYMSNTTLVYKDSSTEIEALKYLKPMLNVSWVWGYYMMFKLSDLPDCQVRYRKKSDILNLNKVAHQDIDFSFRFLDNNKKLGIIDDLVFHKPHFDSTKIENINLKTRKLIGMENARNLYNSNKDFFENKKIDIYMLSNGEIDIDMTVGRFFLKKYFKNYDKYIKLQEPFFKDLMI